MPTSCTPVESSLFSTTSNFRAPPSMCHGREPVPPRHKGGLVVNSTHFTQRGAVHRRGSAEQPSPLPGRPHPASCLPNTTSHMWQQNILTRQLECQDDSIGCELSKKSGEKAGVPLPISNVTSTTEVQGEAWRGVGSQRQFLGRNKRSLNITNLL